MFAPEMPKAFALALLAGFAVFRRFTDRPPRFVRSDGNRHTAPHVPGTQERNNAVSLLIKARQNRSYGFGYDVKRRSWLRARSSLWALGTWRRSESRRRTPLDGHLANFSLTRLILIASTMYDLGSSGPIPFDCRWLAGSRGIPWAWAQHRHSESLPGPWTATR